MSHPFAPDWKLPIRSQIAVRLTIALSRYVPNWPGATDEELDAVAAYLLLSDDIAVALDEAGKPE